MEKKKGKIRAEFRKNRTSRTRRTDWTRGFQRDQLEGEDTVSGERVSGKGDLTRHRTVVGSECHKSDEPGFGVELSVEGKGCLRGRVLSVYGLTNTVQAEDGQIYQCATRRLLKTLNTDQRHVVAAGDRVLFRPAGSQGLKEGIIEKVEPRKGSLCRTVRGRQQVLVTNVEQAILVASAAEPYLKPHLIDRLLVSAEKGRIRPIVCINKVDLVDPASLAPTVGVYSQMGYEVLLLSARSGFGVERLQRRLRGRESVIVGQSGVGKSSLLNAVDPNLQLRVAAVSRETEKGRHTTTTARLIPLTFGGYVVDTPGIRQYRLWDVIAREVAGFFRDLRPYVSRCQFPDCTHTHEEDCAIKNAVADGRLDERRYDSYCQFLAGELENAE